MTRGLQDLLTPTQNLPLPNPRAGMDGKCRR